MTEPSFLKASDKVQVGGCNITAGNGSEFISKAMDKWAYDNHVSSLLPAGKARGQRLYRIIQW